MITFGQQNYDDLKLGNTPYKFSKYGCLSDVVIMGYDWLFNKKKTPYDIVPKLQYNSNGELIWSSLKNIGLELKQRVNKYGSVPRATIDKWWSNPDAFCALEVNNGVHFIWQIGNWIPLLGYKVFDPWTNKNSYSNKYKITGCRIIGKI